MKILHLLKHGQHGNGHVHVAVDLACAQADAGHQVVFAAARSSYADLMRQHGVEVVEPTEPTSPTDLAASGRELWRLCRRVRPDIVNAHMMSSALLAYPVTKALRISLVTTMHNSFDTHSVLMRLGRVVIAVSEAERDLLLARGYRPGKVVTIFNGADGSPREALRADDPPLARPSVMTLSGLHPRKAVDDVITAFADLLADHPDWHLNIVGNGPDRERLEAMVAEMGLGASIHLLGASRSPRPLLEQSEIFATATLADPCPLTVMEARAAGCAIVGTAVGGIPETLEWGRAGQLVPARQPSTLAARLRELMADPGELATWRARARDGADFFSVRRMADDHLLLYASVIAGGPPARPATSAAAR